MFGRTRPRRRPDRGCCARSCATPAPSRRLRGPDRRTYRRGRRGARGSPGRRRGTVRVGRPRRRGHRSSGVAVPDQPNSAAAIVITIIAITTAATIRAALWVVDHAVGLAGRASGDSAPRRGLRVVGLGDRPDHDHPARRRPRGPGPAGRGRCRRSRTTASPGARPRRTTTTSSPAAARPGLVGVSQHGPDAEVVRPGLGDRVVHLADECVERPITMSGRRSPGPRHRQVPLTEVQHVGTGSERDVGPVVHREQRAVPPGAAANTSSAASSSAASSSFCRS